MIPRFECKRCGACCKNMFDRAGESVFGMMLLPEERELFPGNVKPYMAAGTKGRRRERPKKVFAYQMTLDTCPHLTESNVCSIYDKRPLACRAFPIVGRGMLSTKCPEIGADNPSEMPRPLLRSGNVSDGNLPIAREMPADMVNANQIISMHIRQNVGDLWEYNLKTDRWIKVTKEIAIEMLREMLQV